MADFTFNAVKGSAVFYFGLPQASDALILVALKSSGLEADATLKDYTTLSALLAASNDEATNTGYARKSITSVTITTDNTNDWVNVDIADQTWSAVGVTGGGWGKLILCYDGDTGSGTDANIAPLLAFDFVVVPDGSSDITAVFNASGIYRAS